MKLRPDQWQKLSSLLDQALEMPPSQRDEWLARIPQLVPDIAPDVSDALRKLVDDEAGAETAQFLSSLSKLAGESAPEPLPDLRPGESVGAYRLLRELGRGGMGAVWLAERTDGLLKRPVALKLPHLSGAAGAQRERLARERDILAALNHPNIARLYDAGFTSGGQPFLALEYVEGRTLLEDCSRRALGLRERLDLFEQVLEAVRYAHAHLVVHRDLKPSNILVTGDRQVKLLDFGIAKLLAAGEASATELTQVGGGAMTPDYASPEQILGRPITTATDVYSLGVLLFELLCGERPYRLKRKSRAELEEAIVAVEPVAPSALASDPGVARELRGDLDTIVLKTLKKAPAERYESAAALAEDLRRYRAHLPVLAQPDSRWYRGRRFLSRNWVPVSAVAAVFVALLVGTGVALWQARTAVQAQARAEEVQHFVASIFRDTGPVPGKSGMPSAAELLVRASQRVPREFAADPHVAAELDRIIAEGLEQLGQSDAARSHLQQAFDRDRTALGEHDLAVLHIKILLADSYMDQGKSGLAESMLDAAARDLRQRGRSGARALIDALRDLTNIQYEHGGDQCLAPAREAVAVADRWLALDDPQRLVAMSTLVNALRLLDRFPEALAAAQRTADLARQQLGSRRPDERLARAEQDLAYLLTMNDRPAEAVGVARQTLTDITRLHSGESQDVYWSIFVLAQALSLSGQLNEAVDDYRRAIEDRSAAETAADFDVSTLHQQLGRTELEARRPDEAVNQMQMAARLNQPRGDLSSKSARTWQLDRAEALIYLGRIDEARTLVDAVFKRLGADPKQEGWRVAQLRAQASLLSGQGSSTIDLASAALKGVEDQRLGLRIRAALRVTLAQALLDAGRAQAARPLLVEALALYDTAQVGLSPRVADALVGLGRADLELADASSALTPLRRATEFWRQFDPGNLWAAESTYWYGRAQLASGHTVEGRNLIAQARQRLQNSPFALHRRLES